MVYKMALILLCFLIGNVLSMQCSRKSATGNVTFYNCPLDSDISQIFCCGGEQDPVCCTDLDHGTPAFLFGFPSLFVKTMSVIVGIILILMIILVYCCCICYNNTVNTLRSCWPF